MFGRPLRGRPLSGRPLRGRGLGGRSYRSGGGAAAFSPLSLSPLAWWRLNDGSGTTAVDSSGNGYDLTLSNTPTWIAGHIGGGLNFTAASSEKGETSAAGLLASLQGLSAFTVAFWARAASYEATQCAFAIRNNVELTQLFIIYPYSTSGAGNGVFVFFNNDSSFYIDQDSGAASVDAWHHFAFVQRTTTDREMFVDNVSVGTSVGATSLSGTLSHVTIGAWNGGQFFNGDMDEVFIFDRALTAGEMTSLYNWSG